MELLSLTAGVLIGAFALARKGHADYVLILFYSWILRHEHNFLAMYDASNDKDTFAYYIEPTDEDRSYTGYVRLHKTARDSVFAYFRHYYTTTVWLFLGSVVPILVLPIFIFWRQWSFYVSGIFLAILVVVWHKTIIKKHDTLHYRHFIVKVALKSYLRNHPKETK